MKPIRVALYHRVSTADQRPETAREELRAATERYGMTITLEVEETGSGANNDGVVRLGFARFPPRSHDSRSATTH
jgi:DNA invertase Pin-like site-specific DNA recombinase